MAEIGIILATYNGEKYLREQLDSILSNTFKDYEIHICDDGSTDGTIAIAKENIQRNIRRSRCGRMNKIRDIPEIF